MKKKLFKIYLFIFLIAGCLCALNILATTSDQFPDASRLQPMPAGVHPSNPGGINNSQVNSENNALLQQQIRQYEFDESRLDPNISYVDAANGRLFVADTPDNRVLVYNLGLDGALIDDVPDYVLGQPDFSTYDPGTTQSQLNGPNGIAYDPGTEKLFVADTNNNRIMIFDVSSISNGQDAINVLGQQDFTSSGAGTSQSELDSPFAIVYDPVRDVVFVTDSGNNRTLIFDVSSISNGQDAINVLGQPDFTSSKPGDSKVSLNNPSGLAYDSKTDKLFVEDTNNNRVMVFSGSSISNGQGAADVIGQDRNSSISPFIFKRLQSKPKVSSDPARKKIVSAKANFFWPVFVLIIAVVVAVLIFYSAKNKKFTNRANK